jgi:hypothetical protein
MDSRTRKSSSTAATIGITSFAIFEGPSPVRTMLPATFQDGNYRFI